MIPTLELDGIPILFDLIDGYETHETAWMPPDWVDRVEELGDRISYGIWPEDDYPLRGHMLIVSLEKLRESKLPSHTRIFT